MVVSSLSLAIRYWFPDKNCGIVHISNFWYMTHENVLWWQRWQAWQGHGHHPGGWSTLGEIHSQYDISGFFVGRKSISGKLKVKTQALTNEESYCREAPLSSPNVNLQQNCDQNTATLTPSPTDISLHHDRYRGKIQIRQSDFPVSIHYPSAFSQKILLVNWLSSSNSLPVSYTIVPSSSGDWQFSNV